MAIPCVAPIQTPAPKDPDLYVFWCTSLRSNELSAISHIGVSTLKYNTSLKFYCIYKSYICGSLLLVPAPDDALYSLHQYPACN